MQVTLFIFHSTFECTRPGETTSADSCAVVLNRTKGRYERFTRGVRRDLCSLSAASQRGIYTFMSLPIRLTVSCLVHVQVDSVHPGHPARRPGPVPLPGKTPLTRSLWPRP